MKNGKNCAAVIIDRTVPGGMGGLEAIKELVKIDPAAKAIVSSGYSYNPVMADYKNMAFAGSLKTIQDTSFKHNSAGCPFLINQLSSI